MTDHEVTPWHPIGVMPFEDCRLDVSCWYPEDDEPLAGQWLIDVTVWENGVDPHDPPKFSMAMAVVEAREYAALILQAARRGRAIRERRCSTGLTTIFRHILKINAIPLAFKHDTNMLSAVPLTQLCLRYTEMRSYLSCGHSTVG
jgi:hypothetical protein